MNREIKFRAWDTVIKKMTYKEFYITPKGELCFYWQSFGFHSAHSLLMQFTGQKDMEGIEVFEGDILMNSVGLLCEVKWNSDTSCFHVYNALSNYRLLKNRIDCHKVVGNIYANPEMLPQLKKKSEPEIINEKPL